MFNIQININEGNMLKLKQCWIKVVCWIWYVQCRNSLQYGNMLNWSWISTWILAEIWRHILQCLPVSHSKWKAHNPNGIFYPIFCLPLAQFQTGWVFHVNGKQP
jgi:hypothetical protein